MFTDDVLADLLAADFELVFPLPARMPFFAEVTGEPVDAPETVRPTAPKHCGCGATHDYFDWARLPYVGAMSDDVASLELRNCHCGSTLAVELAQ